MAVSRLGALGTPGLRKLCAALVRAGVKCAAVTNAPRANAEIMLRFPFTALYL